MHQDVEKERNLTIYQLKKVKFEVEKNNLGVNELKLANADLKQKVKRYYHLILEQKKINEKAAAEANSVPVNWTAPLRI